ncbi:hypothetical protein QYF36_026976 [Acer negundo]|nr:hypothetical protein QYF36_026976 [Acer negundo]
MEIVHHNSTIALSRAEAHLGSTTASFKGRSMSLSDRTPTMLPGDKATWMTSHTSLEGDIIVWEDFCSLFCLSLCFCAFGLLPCFPRVRLTSDVYAVFVFVLVFAAGAVKALPSGFLFGSSSDPRPHLRFVVPSDADDAS